MFFTYLFIIIILAASYYSGKALGEILLFLGLDKIIKRIKRGKNE